MTRMSSGTVPLAQMLPPMRMRPTIGEMPTATGTPNEKISVVLRVSEVAVREALLTIISAYSEARNTASAPPFMALLLPPPPLPEAL